MNLISLRYFITVAEYSSFTKASERLFVTQPTLSRQILDLEEELGAQLFIRSRHSLVLTPAGHRLLPEAKVIIKKCDNLSELVKNENNDLTGSLRIGYQVFLDTTLMSQALKSITKENPQVDILLSRGGSSELTDDLTQDNYDVIFTLKICVESLPDLEVFKLQDNMLQVAVPRNHRLANQKKVYIKDLADERFILLDRKMSPSTVDYATGLCIKNGFSPNVSYYVNDAETAMLLTGSGKGITFVFSSRPGERSSEDIAILDIEELDDGLDFVLAYKNGNTNPMIPLLVTELLETIEPHETIDS
ncbi:MULTISPECIES: LysR family transcriptional regulator [unclassified Enterococcus]|uniref:LysR family transcriptional regulator n=1 Tax=unclassified Enterococcus TaxID=2608891 RepID=UPI000A349D49|nr:MULTISPECIES: LysR family transcriptional regulator [unclassified Enterococcus]OTO72799.1 hypothetical protein A5865_001754 [Enterococcus sp. 12E11_DIV0728]OUZ14255.1 hypothetical protein A5868_003278 [Enterococcus sp. 12F9_DIV0723]